MSRQKKGGCPDQLRIRFDQSSTTLFMILSIALIAFLTYSDILGYFFTATDTLTLIHTSRIQSLGDVTRIFTEPMMNASSFVEIAKFYRPITTLSYSLDYYIWKLNPFGYQLTNLVLHILVSILVFMLVRSLTNGEGAVAWLSAIFFTTHPILVESVPATARRQDIIAALFLLLSLLLFLKHLSMVPRTKRFLVFSIFFYALAFGAKEIAILLPFLIFAHLAISLEGNSLKRRMVQAIEGSASYFIMTFVLVTWRTYVLKGLGGYANTSSEIVGSISPFMYIVSSYFKDLLYPVHFLGLLFVPIPKTFELAIPLIALLISSAVLIVHGRSVSRSFLISSDNSGLGLFLLIWLFLPLTIYLSTLSFSHRNLYVSVIPFSTIISAGLTESFRSAKGIWNARHGNMAGCSYSSLRRHIANFVLLGGLLLSLFAYSPLLRTYGEWQDSGKISSMFLRRLTEIAPEFPKDAIVHIRNLPGSISSYEARIPHAKTVTYLNDRSIKSWLELHYPSNDVKVVVDHRSRPAALPNDLCLETEARDDHDIAISVELDGRCSSQRISMLCFTQRSPDPRRGGGVEEGA